MTDKHTREAAKGVADELKAPEKNPFALDVPFFSITHVDTLRFLMELEQRAAKTVQERVKSFMEPGMRLTGLDGKPLPETGMKLHQKLTDYLKDVLLQPTLAEEWVEGSDIRMGNLSGSSYQVAYMIYQEFGRLLAARAREFVNVTDAIIIQGLNAMHYGQTPLAAYKTTMKPKAEDEQGNPILGQEKVFHDRLTIAQDVLYQFLDLKKVLVPAPAPDVPPALTLEGVRLLNHLLSVLGSMESMRIQGPEIMNTIMAAQAQGEILTGAEMDAQLANAKKLPEA